MKNRFRRIDRRVSALAAQSKQSGGAVSRDLLRSLRIVAGFLIAYIGVSSFLHFTVFPEATPLPEDRPRSGTEVHLPGGSTFVYRITAVESDGQLFEADWRGEPGAGVPRHTHPSQ